VHHLRATDRVHRGDHSGARTLFDTASRILGEHARQVFEAPEHLKNRGLEAHWAGRFDEAAHLYDEGLALARELQNRNAESAILRFRGELALDRGRLDEAEALLREALSFARGDAMRLAASGAQYVLARTLVRRGDLAQAHPLLERSLRFRATLAAPLMLAEALEAWSEYLAVQGERNLARRTAGAADRLRREFGYPRPAHQAAAQAATLADAGVAPIDADDPPPEDTQWRGVVTVLLAP
jgi:tetratricopeptide (TPR) repeat protein